MSAKHVFDVDGTLIDSARLKTQVFREVASGYGPGAADLMERIHKAAGSSGRRYRVVEFLRQLTASDAHPDAAEEMIADITGLLLDRYFTASLVPGVVDYLQSLDAPAIVVSGIEQDELTLILAMHNLDQYFTGIYGGDKHTILAELVGSGVIELPATYFGDESGDYRAACFADLDFVLVTHGSEWVDPPATVPFIRDFTSLARQEVAS